MLLASSWIGSAPSWLLLAVALGVSYRVTKGGGGTAVTELSKSNEVLKETLDEERGKGVELRARITVLEQKTDVSQVLQPFIKWASEHEEADKARHDITVAAFASVADELKQFDLRADARAKSLATVTAKTNKAQLAVLARIADHLVRPTER